MKRSELISSKEYWATVVALQMWKLNGAKNDKFEKYESMANAIVNDDFIRAMEEYRTQCDKLPGDEEIQDHVEDVDVNFDEEIGFMMGAKWMRSLASPIIASKDARIRELEEENKRLRAQIESNYKGYKFKSDNVGQPKIQMLTACGRFEINPNYISATICKNCGKEKALHLTPTNP